MRLLVVLLGLLVGACGSNYQGLTAIQAGCGYSERPFDQVWPCVKVGVQGAPTDQDLVDQFTSLGDVMAERVRAGQVTDAEAKAVMAEVRTKVNNAAAARYPAPSGGGYRPTVYQRVGNTGTVIAY